MKGNEFELWIASLTTCNFIKVQSNRWMLIINKHCAIFTCIKRTLGKVAKVSANRGFTVWPKPKKPKKESTRHITMFIIKVLDLHTQKQWCKNHLLIKRKIGWTIFFFTVKKYNSWLLVVRPMGSLHFPATAVAAALWFTVPDFCKIEKQTLRFP